MLKILLSSFITLGKKERQFISINQIIHKIVIITLTIQFLMEEIPKKKRYKKKFFTMANSKSLVNYVNKIHKLELLEFPLSEEERGVVGQNQSLIVIGRSGTGKTTCALMRLFSIQILFKNWKAKERFTSQRHPGKYRCRSFHIDQIHGMKNIFLTASPYLILNIQNKYEDLKECIKRYLDSRQLQQGNQHSAQQAQNRAQKYISQLERAQNFLRRAEQRQNNFTSFHKLRQSDYPGFFSIKEFLIMLDGTLNNSFFIRAQDRSRIKNRHDKNLYKIKTNKMETFAEECDWQVFSRRFWKEFDLKGLIKSLNYQRIQYRQITDIIVWTQIITTIKGSYESHLFEGGCLPFERYVKLSKNSLLGDFQKLCVYQICKSYQSWKENSGPYYDFMDFSSHLLRQVCKYYQKQDCSIFHQQKPVNFNHLFLDQVQDQPPVVSYLISLLFTDGLYYSGDVAQTIQKGVEFRFSDLNLMFQDKFPLDAFVLDQPKTHVLRENFRTHNQVLLLANSFIQMLKKTFPSSIDKLEQQISDKNGPKPIYFQYPQFSIQDLSFFLFSHQFIKIKAKGSNTAIIVRNQQEKQQMPEGLKNLDCQKLTIHQAKGLQFYDVIMFNCFDPKLKHLWKILKYTNMYPPRGTFRHDISQIDISQFVEMIGELKILYTIATRTKCTLIIYEQQLPEEIRYVWNHLNILSTQYDIEEIQNERVSYLQNLQNDAMTWTEWAFVFFQRKQYQIAKQYYRKQPGNENMIMKIEAIQLQSQAYQYIKKLQDEFQISKFKQQICEQSQLQSIQQYQTFLRQKRRYNNTFCSAAGKYHEIRQYQNAGRCYLEGQDWQYAITSLSYAESTNNKFEMIGFCCLKLGQVNDALEYYILAGNHAEVYRCYQQLGFYQEAVHHFFRLRSLQERQYYLRKFIKHILTGFELANRKILQIRQENKIVVPQLGKQHELLLEFLSITFYSKSFLTPLKHFYQDLIKICNELRVIRNQIKIELENQFLKIHQNLRNRQNSINFLTYQLQYSQQKQKLVQMVLKQQIQYIEEQQEEHQLIKNFSISQKDQTLRSFQELRQLLSQLQQFNIKWTNKQPQTNILKEFYDYANHLQQLKKTLQLSIQEAKNMPLLFPRFQQLFNTVQIFVEAFRKLEENMKCLVDSRRQTLRGLAFDKIQKQNHVGRIFIYKSQQKPQQMKRLQLINELYQGVVSDWNLLQNRRPQVTLTRQYLQANEVHFDFKEMQRIQLANEQLRDPSLNLAKYYGAGSIHPRIVLSLQENSNSQVIMMRSLLAYFSQFSNNYRNLSHFKSLRRHNTSRLKVPEQLNWLNGSYFNRKLQRTKYRNEWAADELIEGMVLLGLASQIQYLLPQQVYVSLNLLYMSSEKLLNLCQNKPTKFMYLHEANSIFPSGFDDQYRSEAFIERFAFMDGFEINSWLRCTKKFQLIADHEMRCIQSPINKRIQDQQKYIVQVIEGLNKQILGFRKQLKKIVKQRNQFCKQQKLTQRRNEIYLQIQDILANDDLKNQKYQTCFRQQIQLWAKIQRQCNTNKANRLHQCLANIPKRFQQICQTFKVIAQETIPKISPMVRNILKNSPSKEFTAIGIIRIQYFRLNMYEFLQMLPALQLQGDQKSKLQTIYTIIHSQKCYFDRLLRQQQQILPQEFIGIVSNQKMTEIVQDQAKLLQQIIISLKKIKEIERINKEQSQCIMEKIPILQRMLLVRDIVHDLRKIKRQYQQFKIRRQVVRQKQTNEAVLRSKYQFIKPYQSQQKQKFFFLLFANKSFGQIADEFQKKLSTIQTHNNQDLLKLIVIYFSIRKYDRIRENVQSAKHQDYSRQAKNLQSRLLSPWQDENNFRLFCALLRLFKVRLIHDHRFATIFEGMVMVHKDSPLLNWEWIRRQKAFCYYANQDRTCVLMKLSTIYGLLFERLKIRTEMKNYNQFKIFLLSVTKPDYKTQKMRQSDAFTQLFERIQSNKQGLISFFGDYSFDGHQSSQFVYHQLKAYYDLLLMIRCSQPYDLLERKIKEHINSLQEQFRRWKDYARRAEIKKTIAERQ